MLQHITHSLQQSSSAAASTAITIADSCLFDDDPLRRLSRRRRRGRCATTTREMLQQNLPVEEDYFPYCIVWTPLPIITWFVPIIGHTGISDSKGIIYDFSDDFNVSVDNFAFGVPTKYYRFQEKLIPRGAVAWDQAIKDTSDHYARTRHSLFFNNCHEYIADVLNKVKYGGKSNWSQTKVWWMITFRSRYTGAIGFLKQWWPFTVILVAIIVFLAIAL